MYQEKYNSKQLFLNEKFGLQRVYEILAQNNPQGISLENFLNQNQLSISDLPFADLLKMNFNNIDTDKNQVISREEIATLLNSINKQGLTLDQLKALSAQEGYSVTNSNSKSLLSTVLENFNKIDTNNDGRVSEAEINAYNFNKEVEDKKTELYGFKASNISVFYEESSSETSDSDDTAVKITKKY